MDQSRINGLVEVIKEKLVVGKQLDTITRELRLFATQAEIDEAIGIFRKSTPRYDSENLVNKLVDKSDYESWYQGPKSSPDCHWENLKKVLKNKSTRPWNKDMLHGLDISSSAVVAQLAAPKSQGPMNVKGMVIGYVQSGKTANFSAVISKAVDEGYKLVIVLAGMHNILRKQTQARLNEELVFPNEKACATLTIDEEKGDFQKRQNVKANRLLATKDGFTLGVLKKNASVLRSFVSWLDDASAETLSGCPTLIIDDESDQASINTNEPEDDPTAINGLIRDLAAKFQVLTYVGYTATPFANVLVSAEQENDLYPKDFLISLEKPIGYVGTEELFGREAVNNEPAREGYPVIREIPQEEVKQAGHSKQKKNQSEFELPPSLLRAIDSFIIAGSMRLTRGHWQQHMTMLVHTSHIIGDHVALRDAINDHMDLIKMDRQEESEDLKVRLFKMWDEDFKKVSGKYSEAKVAPFDDVWENSQRFTEKIEVIMENSKSEDRLTYDRPDKIWGIVIGGNVLSRGLTLEGLTVSYFHRSSKGYDTLLQMGRWFGFRPDYVDLTRIFVTADMQSKFYHLATVEQEIRDEIRAMAANKEKPMDVGLKIRTHPAMTVTSSLKMRNARVTHLTYAGSKIQSFYVNLLNREILDHNFKTALEFIANVQKYHGNYKPETFDDFSQCSLCMNVKPELIQQFIYRFKFSPANVSFDSANLREYIEEINKYGELTKWSVAVMSNKSGTPIDVGVGKNLFKVDRSVVKRTFSERDPKACNIKSLTVPKDEFIDLKDCFADPTWKSVEIAVDSMPSTKRSEMIFRQTQRPRDRGLVLLYPINGNSTMSDQEYEQSFMSESLTMPIRAMTDFFGVAFVFPSTSKKPNTFKYVVNETV